LVAARLGRGATAAPFAAAAAAEALRLGGMLGDERIEPRVRP
jgi:hypothetical protein